MKLRKTNGGTSLIQSSFCAQPEPAFPRCLRATADHPEPLNTPHHLELEGYAAEHHEDVDLSLRFEVF